MGADIRITYETLFDLLRREKNREELQTLDPDFYEQVLAYLKEKESALQKKEEALFFSAEKEKLKIQFHNIRRIVKELYERREKKIINIALVKARTGSDIMDLSSLLPSEKKFFNDLVMVFGKYKDDILNNIINLRSGLSQSFAQEETRAAIREVSRQEGSEMPEIKGDADDAEENLPPAEVPARFTEDNKKKIKIIDFLPKFMGKNGEILGPFEKGVIVELDPQIADLLVRKGRAEVHS
jgi:DNA replication initiation complex subunit (GINS family)